MYRDHQPIIARWTRAKPENLARAIQFAIVSARIRFYNVPDAMERADQGDPGILWDQWCEEISRLYPNAFPTPDAASAHHLECLGLT